MSILNTFFLRYKADTGQAVKDIEKLGKTEDAVAAKHKKNTKERKVDTKALGETFKETGSKAKELGAQIGEMGTTGGNKLTQLRGVVGSLSEVVGSLGPAAAVAVVGIGAVVGAIAIAREGIEDARVAAKEAIELGEKAFDARLSQNELIRLQNNGRAIGLTDDQVSASAKGMQDKGAEIRAAQRQAARDPASAFNNPLIKQGNLFKKAGVDVSASLEKQVEQQNKYLRALQATGQGERALIEGTQLFGRSLQDIKVTLATTQEQVDATVLATAKENAVRREIQKSSESLTIAENKLEASRKASDERVLSHTIPATEDFTKAVDEWTRSTVKLKDMWGEFVAYLTEGLAGVIKGFTKVAVATGAADDTRSTQDKINDKVGYVRAKNEELYGRLPGQTKPGASTFEADKEAWLKGLEEKERAKWAAIYGAEDDKRKANLQASSKEAVNKLVAGGMSQKGAEAATAKAVTQGEKDPTVKAVEDLVTLAQENNKQQADQGKVQKAQTDYTKKIENNTLALVNTGLEQAMALWAANVGAGSGVSAGGYRGETSGAYEQRAREMQRTINPNASYKMSMDRAAVGQMDGQADAINKAKPTNQPTGGPSSVKIDKIEVHSHKADVAGVAQDMADHVKNEMRYAVAEFASPVVS